MHSKSYDYMLKKKTVNNFILGINKCFGMIVMFGKNKLLLLETSSKLKRCYFKKKILLFLIMDKSNLKVSKTH